MGLTDLLDRVAASRGHVLVAEAPGAFRARVALERAVDHAGWCIAQSVADADVLAVVGDPGEDLGRLIEHAWAQMSEPRTRVHVRVADDVDAELARAREQLRSGGKADTGERRGFTPSSEEHAGHEEHGGHEEDGGHDHGAMMPDGIPLAEGDDDRDGLEMDVSHLPLGPVLPHWPAGLVLRLTLHGEVVVEAEVEQLSATDAGEGAEGDRAARLLDAAASVLALAGLPAEAARARALRDCCLDDQPDVAADVARLTRRIRARRSLGWVLAGLVVTGSHGGSVSLHERLVDLLDRARAEIEQESTTRTRLAPAALPTLVRGKELAEVRLWVAALAPDLTTHEVSEVGHD